MICILDMKASVEDALLVPCVGMVIDLRYRNLDNGYFERVPSYLMVFNTKLAREISFQHINKGEDDSWDLYYYTFYVNSSACYT